MFYSDSRNYIKKLIAVQRVITKKGYKRNDAHEVSKAITELEKYLTFYKFDTDDKMKRFWVDHKHEIVKLLPGEKYPGYNKIINEFQNLNNKL